MDNFFTVKMRHTFQSESGEYSRKTSTFLVNANVFGEAEEKTYLFGKINRSYSGDMKVTSIIPSKIIEVFQNGESGKFFHAKCRYFEESVNGKPMARSHSFLVEAENMKEADINLKAGLDSSSIDYSATELKESQIIEVIDLKTVMETEVETNDKGTNKEALFDTKAETADEEE
jgi:Domain of unknown function (DUF4494)